MQRARAGEMQIVFLTGEAGIGKTALAQAFAEAVSKNDATVVTTHCLPEEAARPTPTTPCWNS